MSNKFANVSIDRKTNTHKDIQKKGVGGRPPVSEKRDKKVFLSLTKKEYNKLLEFANIEDLPVASYVRKILKKNDVI